MGRNRSSIFDDLVEIASRLPWKFGVLLAIASYLGFHFLSSLPAQSFPVTDPSKFAQDLGNSVMRQMMITLSAILQYAVPIAFLAGALVSFLKRRRQSELHSLVGRTPDRNTLESMSWREFEGLTAEVFRRKGFLVVERGGNGPDGGVDLELHSGKDKYLVQCKQWKVLKVGVATVRELYGVMAAERAVGGYVVASGEFTEEARKFAEGRSIELLPAASLLRLVKETGPTSSAPESAETRPGCPKCGTPMVRRTAKRGENAGGAFWGCPKFPACRGIRS